MLDDIVVEYIKNEAKQELEGKDPRQLDAIWNSLNATFQEWKLEHGDINLKYQKPAHKFTLGDFSSLKKNNVSFEDAAPWECAGLEFPSRLGLAIKLLIYYPSYMDFMEMMDRSTSLALLIDRETEPVGDMDWFLAHDYMVRGAFLDRLIPALLRIRKRTRAGRKQLENLAKGPSAAAKKKRERTKDFHAMWKKWAYEYWKKAPAWKDANDALDHVCSLVQAHGHKMANSKPYARRTIQNVIVKVRDDLKKQE